jgi:hypothetical protein
MFYPLSEADKEKNYYTFACSVKINTNPKLDEKITKVQKTDNMQTCVMKEGEKSVEIIFKTTTDVKNSSYEVMFRTTNMHVPRLFYEKRTVI